MKTQYGWSRTRTNGYPSTVELACKPRSLRATRTRVNAVPDRFTYRTGHMLLSGCDILWKMSWKAEEALLTSASGAPNTTVELKRSTTILTSRCWPWRQNVWASRGWFIRPFKHALCRLRQMSSKYPSVTRYITRSIWNTVYRTEYRCLFLRHSPPKMPFSTLDRDEREEEEPPNPSAHLCSELCSLYPKEEAIFIPLIYMRNVWTISFTKTILFSA